MCLNSSRVIKENDSKAFFVNAKEEQFSVNLVQYVCLRSKVHWYMEEMQVPYFARFAVIASVSQVTVFSQTGPLSYIHHSCVEVMIPDIQRHHTLNQVISAGTQVTKSGFTVMIPVARAAVIPHVA